MRKVIALILGSLLPVLGFADVGLAQAVQVQGTIQAVDCQNQTVVLSSPSGSNTIAAADSTAVLVNSTSVSFCTLQQYLGAPVTAWLVPSGSEFEVTRIDVDGPAAAAAPAPAVTAPATLGLVLGAIAIAGLAYLAGRQSANQAPPAYASTYQDTHGRWGPQYGDRYQQCARGARNHSCPDPTRPTWSR